MWVASTPPCVTTTSVEYVHFTAGEAMRQFVAEGKGHMEWNMGFQTFDKASPQDPPMMEAQVKVLCQIKKKFL